MATDDDLFGAEHVRVYRETDGERGYEWRGTTILRHLAEDGVTPEALARVHVPIGLDLGARSAPEIALAILAEIQAVRSGGSGRSLSTRT